MLIGTYQNNLGDKNRIALPKKFCQELGESLIITKGYDNCLIIVNEQKWNKLISSFEQIPFVNSEVRDTRRFLIGSATEITTDSQGRFVLPDHLKSYSKINKNGTFLGLIDWVELWDSEIWKNKEENINNSSNIIAQKVSDILIEDNRK